MPAKNKIVKIEEREYLQSLSNEFAPMWRTSVIDGKRYKFNAGGTAFLLNDDLDTAEVATVDENGNISKQSR
jgi:hypothetical protein